MTGYVKIIVVSLLLLFFFSCGPLCGPVEGDLEIYIFIRKKDFIFFFKEYYFID